LWQLGLSRAPKLGFQTPKWKVYLGHVVLSHVLLSPFKALKSWQKRLCCFMFCCLDSKRSSHGKSEYDVIRIVYNSRGRQQDGTRESTRWCAVIRKPGIARDTHRKITHVICHVGFVWNYLHYYSDGHTENRLKSRFSRTNIGWLKLVVQILRAKSQNDHRSSGAVGGAGFVLYNRQILHDGQDLLQTSLCRLFLSLCMRHYSQIQIVATCLNAQNVRSLTGILQRR